MRMARSRLSVMVSTSAPAMVPKYTPAASRHRAAHHHGGYGGEEVRLAQGEEHALREAQQQEFRPARRALPLRV